MGADRLSAALAQLGSEQPQAEVSVRWRSFVIDPSTKAAGEDYLAYNRRRWGGDGWTHDLPGKAAGTAFRNWRFWPNTVLAHTLLLFARKTHGRDAEARLMAVLFQQLYEEGCNISSEDTLLAAAQRAGIAADASAAHEALRSPALRREMAREDAAAKAEGVDGVPAFKIWREDRPDERLVMLSGAQPPAAFLRVFRRLLLA